MNLMVACHETRPKHWPSKLHSTTSKHATHSTNGHTMLVLSRHPGEEIVINEDIVIEVIEIGHNKVRLGITAPDSVGVHRREVYEAIIRNTKRLNGGGQ